MKVVLGCSRKEAWKLISTHEGLESWFSRKSIGNIARDEIVEFHWDDLPPDKLRILAFNEGYSLEHEWFQDARVRYELQEGPRLVFVLTVTYPGTRKGRERQIAELVPWSFMLSNLRSITLGGADIRTSDPTFSWKDGFID